MCIRDRCVCVRAVFCEPYNNNNKYNRRRRHKPLLLRSRARDRHASDKYSVGGRQRALSQGSSNGYRCLSGGNCFAAVRPIQTTSSVCVLYCTSLLSIHATCRLGGQKLIRSVVIFVCPTCTLLTCPLIRTN